MSSAPASFQILSHAGLRVRAGGAELLTDPWITGSSYWRSWWNYPPVPPGLSDELAPDFIYLTHLHWDHFHAPSLRRFANTPVIVPYDRYGRMVKDLRDVGIREIIELRHGQRMQLSGDLALTSYHISPFVLDSAVIIEAGDQVLFNANDAKLAGAPLNQVLSEFPRVDFCFRSHSSANPRSCFHYIGEPDAETDDNEHYLRSFSLFMRRVRPRFAIPFASNSCLLHDDVYAMNERAQTPLMVDQYFSRFAVEEGLDTKLQIMVAGDKWSSDEGFSLSEQDWFTDRPAHLADYRARIEPTLERQRKLEANVKVPLGIARKFFAKVHSATPKLFMRPLKDHEVLVVANSQRETTRFAVDLYRGKVRVPDESETFDMRIELPALILLQSMTMNMFGHAGISKRVQYHAARERMPALKRFVTILEYYEAELFPIRSLFTKRTVRALLPRWREGLLYARVLADVARGLSLPAVEERLLLRRS